MIGDACVFALTQIANEFACEHGELVTRRAGPDIACQSATSQQQCIEVYEYLKNIGLAELGYEDDLTQVPHGVWSKIQFGGLLGLNQLCNFSSETRQQEKLENISQLIETVTQEYADIEAMPVDKVIAAMHAYRSRRRKK